MVYESFVNYDVLIDESEAETNYILVERMLQTNGFKLSRSKTKHTECNFSNRRYKSKGLVTINREETIFIVFDRL